MKLTYLGTAASEGMPAVFCNCKYCVEARRLGGKNIRTRSQTLINNDMLIDFPADTYHHFLTNGIEGDLIKYLVITHAHEDHFYKDDLLIRGGAYAKEMRVPTLKVFCSGYTAKMFSSAPKNVEINVIKAFDTVQVDGYRITALPARHMPEGEALIYIIEGDKTLLYAHDTGYFYEEVFSYIEENKKVFDMVSLDCTNVDIPAGKGSHMDFANIKEVLERLSGMGAVNDKTIKYVNHFSHNGNPIHHIIEENAKQYGCLVAYDGCQVNI
ncbi:MAG: MBL fold metallo-hydrolase [Ruminococcaceae bacterium]|nr:MBL fold metallo-hydrolase [Oscillospiraceae bacterium]